MGRNLQRDVGGWKWHQSKAVPHPFDGFSQVLQRAIKGDSMAIAEAPW
jgi:hypothetical protein